MDNKTKDIKNIGENILWGDKKVVEMVVHPAIVAQYKYFGTLTETRLAEWKMFSSIDTLDYLHSKGIEVANFGILDN